ncbi:MAG: response regulator [Candidatus Kapaibacterium sp.]
MSLSSALCVIEDNTAIRSLYCALLKKAGYEVIDFENGYSALAWIENNKPGCVIMDILLPDLNGTELIDMIKDLPNGEDIPLIAVTGFSQPEDEVRYVELGFDSYIAKPVDTETFAERVKTILAAHKSR